MRGNSVVRVKRYNSRSVVIRWSPAADGDAAAALGDRINVEVGDLERLDSSHEPAHQSFTHFFSMKSDRVIESAIRAAQNLLWQNLPPTHNLPDAAAVARLRDIRAFPCGTVGAVA